MFLIHKDDNFPLQPAATCAIPQTQHSPARALPQWQQTRWCERCVEEPQVTGDIAVAQQPAGEVGHYGPWDGSHAMSTNPQYVFHQNILFIF